MKDLISLFAFTLLTLPLFAQTTYEVHAGPSVSWVEIDGISETVLPERNAAWTYQAGVGLETALGNSLYFKTGLDYVQRGFQTEWNEEFNLFQLDIPVGVEATTTMDYVSVPVKLHFETPGDVQFYVNAGPRIAYAVDGRVRTRASLILEFNTGIYDLDPKGNLLRQWDIGGEVESGIQWTLPKGQLGLGIQYYHGFSNALNDPIIAIDFRNRSLGAQLSYKFNF